jgi:putative two-component system response regulator
VNNTEHNTILIVDDESFNLDLLEMALMGEENIETIRAENGYIALKKVREYKIDLIILDISMPEMNGLDVLKELKSDEKLRYIPVIMATAKDEERHQALELGSEDFLAKPIDVKELRFRVANLLKLKKFNDLQQFFNQRLEEEVAKKEQQLRKFVRVEQELELARVIQQRLIPKTYPEEETIWFF